MPRSVLALLLALGAVFSGLPAAACPEESCCADECSDDRDASHEGSDRPSDDSPTCPPLCQSCPSSAPVVSTPPVLAIVVIQDFETQPAVGAAPTPAKAPPPSGVFHPPRLSA